jgi:hypothetical protein
MIGVGSRLIGYGDDATSMLSSSLEDATNQLNDVFRGETTGFVPQQ